MDTPDSTTPEFDQQVNDFIGDALNESLRRHGEFRQAMRKAIGRQYFICRFLGEAIEAAGHREKRVPEVLAELVDKGMAFEILSGGLMPDAFAEFCAHDEHDNCDDCLNAIVNRWYAIHRFLETSNWSLKNDYEEATGTYFFSGKKLEYDDKGAVIYDTEYRR